MHVLHRCVEDGEVYFNVFTLNSVASLCCHTTLLGLKRWVARSMFTSSPSKAAERLQFLFRAETVVNCPQQPGSSVDCGAYVVMFARCLFEGRKGLTEEGILQRISDLPKGEEGHRQALLLRCGMLKDLGTHARFGGHSRQTLMQFGTGVEQAQYVLSQLGGMMETANLRGACMHMHDVLGHMRGVVEGKQGEDEAAVGAFWKAMSCAAQRPTSTKALDGVRVATAREQAPQPEECGPSHVDEQTQGSQGKGEW